MKRERQDEEEGKPKPRDSERERDWAEKTAQGAACGPLYEQIVIEMPVVGDCGDLEFAEIVSEGEDRGRHCSLLVGSEIAG